MLSDHIEHFLLSFGTFPQAKDNKQPQTQRFTVSALPPEVIYQDSRYFCAPDSTLRSVFIILEGNTSSNGYFAFYQTN